MTIDKYWIEYQKTLERLLQIVQEQTTVLQDRDWRQLNQLYARKENVFLTLQMLQNKLSGAKQNDSKDKTITFRKDIIGDKFNLIIVKGFIEQVLKIEERNAVLLNEAMKAVRGEIIDLNQYKRKSILYLEPAAQQTRTTRLNLVS